MDAQRWVVVRDGQIVEGPILWDGHTEWAPPVDGELMLEDDAIAAGHTYDQ